MSKRSPNGKWEQDFYSSQLYRVLKKVRADDVEKTVNQAIDIAGQTVHKAEKIVDAAVGRGTSKKDDVFHAGSGGPYSSTQPPASSASPYDTRTRNPYEKTTAPGGYRYGEKKKRRNKKDEPIPEGMRRVRKPSVVKFYVTGFVALFVGCTTDSFYAGADFLGFAILLVIVYFICSKIFKGKWVLEPIPQAPAPEPKFSGNPEVDKVVQEGTDYLRRLRQADENIENEEISNAIVRMEDVSFRIFAYICDHPKKVPQIRKFMNYYLPTTLKLLDSYDRMSQQDVAGENITQSMTEIERIMQTIVLAFEKQLDALFQDEAMDISADITVLEGMMAQEGISTEDKKPGQEPTLKL